MPRLANAIAGSSVRPGQATREVRDPRPELSSEPSGTPMTKSSSKRLSEPISAAMMLATFPLM